MRQEIRCATAMLCALGMVSGSAAAGNSSLAPLTRSLYSVTRDNGAESNGWDDLPIANAQKDAIRQALFGDGTGQGSLIQSVAVGGDKNKFIGNNPYGLTANIYKQNPLDRIADVLNALGVPMNGGQHYWLADHYNHFHVNIRPPTQTPVEILASNNLTATGPVLADAGSSITTAAQKEKYDAAFSVCGAAVPTTHRDYGIANVLSPLTAAYSYFYKLGITPAVGPTNVTIIEGPSHGELSTKGLVLGAYRYIPNEGYLGPDQMTFVVEWMGKKFKVIETLWIENASPESNFGCIDNELPPATTGDDKGGALDVIELPVDGTLDTDALAKLHAFVTFAAGTGLAGVGGKLNIADLPGAAVGQTIGTDITLDTNASGYNWFIDTTPGLNEEFLPTSNPNEWVAKAGSAAAGKMDMLSVLLNTKGARLELSFYNPKASPSGIS